MTYGNAADPDKVPTADEMMAAIKAAQEKFAHMERVRDMRHAEFNLAAHAERCPNCNHLSQVFNGRLVLCDNRMNELKAFAETRDLADVNLWAIAVDVVACVKSPGP